VLRLRDGDGREGEKRGERDGEEVRRTHVERKVPSPARGSVVGGRPLWVPRAVRVREGEREGERRRDAQRLEDRYSARMKISAGNNVRIEYEIRVKGGDVIESSAKSGPIQYVHGEGKLLPALEKRLEGRAAGSRSPARFPRPRRFLPRTRCPNETFRAASSRRARPSRSGRSSRRRRRGRVVNLRILEIHDDRIKVRLLPPLAGKDLAFSVKIIRIEDP